MNKKQQVRQLMLLVCTLGLLFCTQSVNAQFDSSCRPQIIVTDTKLGYEGELNDTCKQRLTTFSDALKELAKANVVYLGETHDNPEDHKIQLQIIQELQRRNPKKIAIAMEMFQGKTTTNYRLKYSRPNNPDSCPCWLRKPDTGATSFDSTLERNSD